MARMARVVVPHYPHHVTQRGNRRQTTFFQESDYSEYCHLLATACRAAATEVWAYCLMPNHVHLVLVPSSEDGLRAALGEAHRRYTRSVNFREGWRGHLWQERFHSFVMDERYLLAAVRYVEMNPVRARLCGRPEEWMWSSAKAHLNKCDDGLVKVAPMLKLITDWQSYLDASMDESEMEALRRHSRTGRPLGNDKFIDGVENVVGRCVRAMKAGRRRLGGE